MRTPSALNAAVVYYGATPNDAPPAAQGAPPAPFVAGAALANVKAPVLGLYGGQDQGIPLADVEKMRAALAANRSGV